MAWKPFLEHLRSATDALDWTFKNLRERIAADHLRIVALLWMKLLALLANIPESGEAKLRIKLQMAYSRLAPLAVLMSQACEPVLTKFARVKTVFQ